VIFLFVIFCAYDFNIKFKKFLNKVIFLFADTARAVFKGGGLRDQPPEMLTFFSVSIVFVYIVKQFVKMHTNRHQEAKLLPPDTFLSRKNAQK